MTQEHPIVPPDELVMEWINKHYGGDVRRGVGGVERTIATQAARWGADQELEACCELLDINGCPGKWIDMLRAARRRPKKPSEAEVALELLNDVSPFIDAAHENGIRRALERLQELESKNT